MQTSIIQVDLVSDARRMTTWVDKHLKLKQGAVISLKGDPAKWLVARLYPQTHSAQDFDWHRKWDNNI